jgi:DNA repair protein RadC
MMDQKNMPCFKKHSHEKISPPTKAIKGHRKRAKQRAKHMDPHYISDEDIFELLLFHMLVRKDVKPMAQKLLKAFGSFSAILQAPKEALQSIEGVGCGLSEALHALKLFCDRRLLQDIRHEKNLLNSFDNLMVYLRHTQGLYTKEVVRILFLDSNYQLIAEETPHQGTVNQTLFYTREIIERCFLKAASAFILVHNHPSGDASPSNADIEATKHLMKACDSIQIEFIDHIIIAQNNYFSFRKKSLNYF